MIKIKTQSTRGREIVLALLELIEAEGGFVHANLQLEVSKTGDVSFSYARHLEAGELLIDLPLTCMPILSDYDYALVGGKLQATAKAGREVSSARCRALALSVELYNLYGKVEGYSSVCPSVQLCEHKELLSTLLDGADASLFAVEHFSDLNELKMFCFWHARAYHDVNSGTDRMLPVLEFVDHHSFADGFRPGFTGAAGESMQLHFAPVEKGRVLACYAVVDALECYVKYGFFDGSAFFVKSLPFTVVLPGLGELQVNKLAASQYHLAEQNWSCEPKYTNSLFYAAQVRMEPGAVPEICYAFIPPKRHIPAFDDALQQQLTLFERAASLQSGLLNNADAMQIYKRALVAENKKYLHKVVGLAKAANLDQTAPATRMLLATLRHQLKLVQQFEKFGGL